MRNFKQLKIWQKGFEIAVQTFKLVSTFPREERFGLTSQITKAGVSIPSNIAEGSSRSSEKEYSHYVEIALGSSYELETQILIAEAVNFGELTVRDNLLYTIMEEQRMLVTFMSRLNK